MIDPLELHAYADGELTQTEEDRIRQQLQDDPQGQLELRTIQGLKATLSKHCEPVECRAQWSACVGRLNELDKTRRTETFVGKYAWALCGVIMLFILAGGVATRLGPGNSMGSPDLARAVASLGAPSRPSSQQPEEVRRWLDGIVGTASKVISPDRLTVLGASTGEMDGYRVSQIALRDRNGDLNLMMLKANLDLNELPSAGDGRYHTSKLQGTNCIAWNDGGMTLVLAGERSFEELKETAENIMIDQPSHD
jgi:hypothetical protein